MAEKIHEAEIFVRKTLLRNPKAQEYEKQFLSGRDTFSADDWPSWCALPMGTVYAMLTHGVPFKDAKAALVHGAGAAELSNLTAALIWSRNKMIYRFDAELLSALCMQPMDGRIPEEPLYQLPCFCPFVEHTFQFKNDKTVGFFAWLERDAQQNTRELRILYLMKSGYSVSVPIILTGGTLADSMDALYQSAVKNMQGGVAIPPQDYEAMPYPQEKDLIATINIILYLCSEKPDIPDAEQLQKKRSRLPNGTPKRTAVQPVGTRIGAALRLSRVKSAAESEKPAEAEQAAEQTKAASSHASPIPHIRRAHWHLFWTGKRDGTRKAVIKWLPPIPVNLEGAELQPAIRLVKPTEM